jgi:urate oxidase
MEIDGKPHPHSFLRDGAETRIVESVTRKNEGISIRSKIEKLLVLKSTGSAFYGFHRDEYTRLPETWDRILSTEVEAGWKWKKFASLAAVKSFGSGFDKAWQAAREITLKTFAEDNSASVQATMYKMADKILSAVPEVEAVDYSLPNKHYFEVGEWTRRLNPNRSNIAADMSNQI